MQSPYKGGERIPALFSCPAGWSGRTSIHNSNDGGFYGKHYGGATVLVVVPCLYTMKGGGYYGGNDYFAHCLCTDTGH